MCIAIKRLNATNTFPCTRGECSTNIDFNNDWQNGQTFMTKAIKYWPIDKECSIRELPKRNSVVFTTIIEVDICPINIERFSRYVFLINVTATRVLALRHKYSLKTIFDSISAEQYIKSELLDNWSKKIN